MSKLHAFVGRTSPAPIVIDELTVDARRKANWARLIQKVYEIDPLECLNCGTTMRIIALIDDADVVNLWNPPADSVIPKGPDSRPDRLPHLSPRAGHRLSAAMSRARVRPDHRLNTYIRLLRHRRHRTPTINHTGTRVFRQILARPSTTATIPGTFQPCFVRSVRKNFLSFDTSRQQVDDEGDVRRPTRSP